MAADREETEDYNQFELDSEGLKRVVEEAAEMVRMADLMAANAFPGDAGEKMRLRVKTTAELLGDIILPKLQWPDVIQAEADKRAKANPEETAAPDS